MSPSTPSDLFPSRRSPAPAGDGSIAPDALGWPGVTALRRRLRSYLVDHQIVVGERLEALYQPAASQLARELGPGSRLLGFVRHRLNLLPGPRHPRILFLYGPQFAIPDPAAGTWETWAPLPAGFDPDHAIEDGLEAEIARRLGHHTVAACRRLTLAPLNLVEAVADCLPARQLCAMQADAARPLCLAITAETFPGKAGAPHSALHVVAWEGARGDAWTLAVLDRALGEEDLAACIAEAITELPHPEALAVVVTGAGAATRRVVSEAMAMAQRLCPAFAAEAVVLRRRRRRPGTHARLGDAVARLTRNLQALWREAPLTIARLEQRALVRQGYCARRRLAPTRGGRCFKPMAFVKLMAAAQRPASEQSPAGGD